MALPLWLSKDGEHVVDAELIMPAHEAEGLHAAVCHFLGDLSNCGQGKPQGRSPWSS